MNRRNLFLLQAYDCRRASHAHLEFDTNASHNSTIAFGAQPAFASVPTAGLSDVGVSAYLDTGQTIDPMT